MEDKEILEIIGCTKIVRDIIAEKKCKYFSFDDFRDCVLAVNRIDEIIVKEAERIGAQRKGEIEA